MSFNRARFLVELLGADGARALAKASDRSGALGDALVPRTIVAWLRSVDSFDGNIPGSDFKVSFSKSEHGFTGHVQLRDNTDYHFRDKPLVHLAGALSVALGVSSTNVPDEVRRLDLERLGKSVDLMVKVERVKKLKVSAGQSRTEESSPGDAHGEYSRQEIYQKDEKKPSSECEVCGGKGGKHNDRLVAGQVLKCRNAKLTKAALNPHGGAGGTGTTAGPVAPAAPTAPTATAPKPSTKQALPKPAKSATAPGAPTTVKLSQSEITHPCSACGRLQFNGPEFVGCSCFRALAKSVTVVSFDADTADIKFGDGWDRESIVTLLEAVGRK